MTAAISQHIAQWYKERYPDGAADLEVWAAEHKIEIEQVSEKDGKINKC